MDLDSFFGWYFTHNQLLINAIILAILGFVALALFFSLWRGKSGEPVQALANGAIDELEKTLRRVLDTVPQRPATEVARAASLIQDEDEGRGPPSAEFQLMVETLKKDVTERDRVIQSLRVDLDKISQTTGLSEADKKRIQGLEAELQEAKSRLSEYEIIEDDIANLSLYKAENSQLKTELEKLRRGKAIKDDPNAVPQVSDIVAEFAAIVGAEDNPPTPVTPATAKASAAPQPQAAPAPVKAAAPEPAPEVSSESPLEIDPNKLIAEATSLEASGGEISDEEDEEDSKQKLISEFESFIKNG